MRAQLSIEPAQGARHGRGRQGVGKRCTGVGGSWGESEGHTRGGHISRGLKKCPLDGRQPRREDDDGDVTLEGVGSNGRVGNSGAEDPRKGIGDDKAISMGAKGKGQRVGEPEAIDTRMAILWMIQRGVGIARGEEGDRGCTTGEKWEAR
jgi:hypothetical protein